MSWEIQIPHRGPGQPILDALNDVRVMDDPEDRATAREVLFDALLSGTQRVGEVLDRIERADPAERREILDRARIAAGLDSTADAEGHREFVRANQAIARRPRPPLPSCAVCGAHPTGPGGMPEEVPPVRKWHCPDHEDQAAPGDMDPPPSPIDPLFGYIEPDEAARAQREDELRVEQQRLRLEQRAHDAEQRRLAAEARAERWRPTGPGWTK